MIFLKLKERKLFLSTIIHVLKDRGGRGCRSQLVDLHKGWEYGGETGVASERKKAQATGA
eukprot:348874-Hanusia_phi.AAC.1